MITKEEFADRCVKMHYALDGVSHEVLMAILGAVLYKIMMQPQNEITLEKADKYIETLGKLLQLQLKREGVK